MHIQRLQLQRAHLNSSSPTSDTSIWDSVRSPSSALAVHVGAPTELLLKCGLLLALVRLAGVHARIPRWHTGAHMYTSTLKTRLGRPSAQGASKSSFWHCALASPRRQLLAALMRLCAPKL